MRSLRKSITRIAIAIGFTFLVSSTILFWLPFARHYVSAFIPDYINTIFPDYIDFFTPDAGYADYSYLRDGNVEELRKRIAEQSEISQIIEELRRKPNAELFELKAHYDVCRSLFFDCRGLDSGKVKPFIEGVLADRQIAESQWASWIANYISAGSLLIAFFALLVSLLAYLRAKRVRVS